MVKIKTNDQIKAMRKAGEIVARVLAELQERVKPGITTGELDRVAEELTYKFGAVPAFKGYQVGGRVYPAALCISVNEEVVHGIPSRSRRLQEGDIVGLDFGVRYQGVYGDAAITVAVGCVDEESQRLIRTAEAALWAGIQEARPGKRVGDISAAIQETVEAAGFSVVRQFVGHGIGERLHEDPQVPNFGRRDRGERLVEGMALAIEPMVNAGSWEVEILQDGWTAVTRDRRRSAHFEHSVLITRDGAEVLTQV
ncbi:MAG: type I methionyl aminopeptidase [Candidatus Binatia bacterium]|nr:type I methionyl aminopeptidase [Candidatus Binatia bacterium]